MPEPVRVSHIALFKRWKEQEDTDIGWLLNALRSNEETEAMRKGTAFHKALELACETENAYFVEAMGYTFHFTCEAEIALPTVREIRRFKDYGGITVTGQADGIVGRTIIDYKSTETFEAERYLTGVQHKFYLDMWEYDRFQWFVFEMKEMDEPKHYCVHAMHTLTQYPYAGMAEECRELAQEFRAFRDKWLPDWHPMANATQEPPPPPKPAEPHWEMKATRGRNLIAVGWRDGILRCAFSGREGNRFYSYKGVPEAEFHKLLRSPFPDALFASNVKGKYETVKEAA